MKIFAHVSVIIILLVTFTIACSSDDEDEPIATPSPPDTPTEVWVADGVISAGEYAASQTHSDFEIYWVVEGQFIHVGMRADTDGWVSVAIQPGKRMKDADMIFGYVEDGKVTVFDLFSTGDFGPHPPDIEQGGTDDVLEFGGTETEEFTTIEFKRALVTGDEFDNELSPGTNQIIWAYGSSDSLSPRHSKRGYGEIVF